jgi:hypothetical protein
MLVSVNQSIDMLCIVLSVKFDGGPFISVLKNKQLYKKMDVKSLHFQKAPIFQFVKLPFEERTDFVKSLTFFEAHFPCEQDARSNSNLT